jgi:two-component system, OmpR family, phosphate regulon response regulator PhoB
MREGVDVANRILIVEDEQDLLLALEYNLEREGYSVVSASTGTEALRKAESEPKPELVLLDLMLPDMTGTEVCRTLKSNANTKDIPVIMVTAKGEEIDRVVGFEVGADDYVVKPFSMRELVLRVRAILKRAQPAEEVSELFHFGSLKVDKAAHRLWVNDKELQLTALEFRLLSTIYSRRGRVQTRDRLLVDVWGYQADVTTRTVDTHIKRLREKLGDAGHYIMTVRGVGYRFMNHPEDVNE